MLIRCIGIMQIQGYQRYIYAGIAAIVIAVGVGLAASFNASSGGVLEVDAFADQADVVGMYRVTLKNNGNEDLRNIVVDFGNHEVTIPKLRAGEMLIVSPKEEVIQDYIIVKADPDILIKKEFRSAPRMPGMIGGMG